MSSHLASDGSGASQMHRERPVRTRIAPSPTGFLHLGTARTALYSWAYARHHGGQFVLRIEDTDVVRSTQDSVDQILQAMHWLGLNYDEGPIYQMQRLARYHAVVQRMLADGTAYRCWCTPQELDVMREVQRARGDKRTRYDGRWRPAPGKVLPPPPAGIQPVIRFANPLSGEVSWNDLVKGSISISNDEIDDLIILRPASHEAAGQGVQASKEFGIPTYNFAVVVDDLDMAISHVYRGDEHINNTPWQINMFRALGAEPPQYGHCPIILDSTGQKLSKRRGAVSVTAYRDAGYLPEAMLNYLARLGWSHGDAELFSLPEMVQWFDGTHLAKSPAQWDSAKLAWVNAHHLKQADDARLARLVQPFLTDKLNAQAQGLQVPQVPSGQWLESACALFKDRSQTLVNLAECLHMVLAPADAPAAEVEQHLTPEARAAMPALARHLGAAHWDKASIAQALKATLAECGLKMPQLAPAVRVLAFGRSQTPSVDAVLALANKAQVLARLNAA